jgi:hypothetical protein
MSNLPSSNGISKMDMRSAAHIQTEGMAGK